MLEINNYNPIVSIIMTLFNKRDYVKRAIDSLINQSLTEWELLIVDDGSSDLVEDIVIPMIKNDFRIKYIRHTNRNLPTSRNTGVLLCYGKYVTFLDADDAYLETHLENRVSYMNNNKSVDMLHSTAKLVGEEKDFFVVDITQKQKLIHLDDCVIGGTFFGKKEVFNEIAFSRENPYGDDSDFFNRAASRFNTVKADLQPTYLYYCGIQGSLTSNEKELH
jgi:glycosyltransferase involved in cell wall biosynthesis